MRNPADMIVLDRVAKNVFHIPGIARVQDITRPLGTPIDHSSVPFQISLQAANMAWKTCNICTNRVADMTKVSDQLQVTIDITQRISEPHPTAHRRHPGSGWRNPSGCRSDTNDIARPHRRFRRLLATLRSYFYWERTASTFRCAGHFDRCSTVSTALTH